MNIKKVPALSDIRGNANGTDKEDLNTELVQRKDIEGTPFTVITTDDGSFGVMGKWRLTDIFEKPYDAEKEVKAVTWNRIIQVTSLISSELFKVELKKDKEV